MSCIAWTDPSVTSATHIRAIHVNELRSAIDRDRVAVGLARYSWSDGTVTSRTHIRAVHFTELRTAIQDIWTHVGRGTLPNWSVGSAPSPSRQVSARDIMDLRSWVQQYDPASIIGAHHTNNSRNWAGKAGWDVQLIYSNVTDDDPNGFNTVAGNVQSSHQSGRTVLLRVDYRAHVQPTDPPPQSVPPDDTSRLAYNSFLQRICSDTRFNQNVWGYIIGNEFNRSDENGGGTPITPTWYARVFNGYNAPAGDTGNAVQTIKANQPGAQVLVGAVGPWVADATSDDGSTYLLDAPWLNYFNEVCRNVYSAAGAKGLPVDGLSIHAYGRTGTNGQGNNGPNEPHTDVQFVGWPIGVWYGFTVYKNWRDIINQFDTAVPVFVTETNTDTDAHSYQSYPTGWYLQALSEICTGGGPRFWALCWFVDVNYGVSDPATMGFWYDSLTEAIGACASANSDFNSALTSTSN